MFSLSSASWQVWISASKWCCEKSEDMPWARLRRRHIFLRSIFIWHEWPVHVHVESQFFLQHLIFLPQIRLLSTRLHCSRTMSVAFYYLFIPWITSSSITIPKFKCLHYVLFTLCLVITSKAVSSENRIKLNRISKIPAKDLGVSMLTLNLSSKTTTIQDLLWTLLNSTINNQQYSVNYCKWGWAAEIRADCLTTLMFPPDALQSLSEATPKRFFPLLQ